MRMAVKCTNWRSRCRLGLHHLEKGGVLEESFPWSSVTPVKSEDPKVVSNRSPRYANLGLKTKAGEYSFVFFLFYVRSLTLS